MIGRTWAEWEESLSVECESEEDYANYRATVGKETPDLRLEADIKSECGGGYETELVRCDWCNLAFKICHLRAHVLTRHPEMPEIKYTPPETSTIQKVKKEALLRPNDQFNNNTLVKKRSNSPIVSETPTTTSQPSTKRIKKEKDERTSIFFSRRENPVVIFGECDEDDKIDVVEPHRSYINHYMKPIAYPRYGCYVDKNAKMHAYSSASRNLNQKLQLLQSPILQGMEQTEFEGSSPMTPLSQPSPNLPPKLNKLAHVRVQH